MIKTGFVICLSLLVLLIPTYGSSIGKSSLFNTFANENQSGNLSVMNFDGKFYWFGAQFGGNSLRYDPANHQFYKFNFNRGNTVEGVSSIEIVNDQVWFGLYTVTATA
jgi:streptogramin lyase